MDKEMDQIFREIKQTGYLNHRYTKKDTTSREYGYYINLEGSEARDIDFRYGNGRVHSDVIEKLGLFEDIFEKINVPQLLSFIRTKEE